MLEPKKHGFCLAVISRVQGSSKRVTLKALGAVMTADDWTGGVLSCYCHGRSVLCLFTKSLSLDMIRWHVIVG